MQIKKKKFRLKSVIDSASEKSKIHLSKNIYEIDNTTEIQDQTIGESLPENDKQRTALEKILEEYKLILIKQVNENKESTWLVPFLFPKKKPKKLLFDGEIFYFYFIFIQENFLFLNYFVLFYFYFIFYFLFIF